MGLIFLIFQVIFSFIVLFVLFCFVIFLFNFIISHILKFFSSPSIDLSCSANEKTTTKEGEGEGGKKADLVEKFLGKFVEREGEKQEGGLEAEIVVLIQHSQAFGAKFYPKKNVFFFFHLVFLYFSF